MPTGTGTLIELRLESEGLSGRIHCPPGLRPAPGQYLVASGADPCDPLPTILFPSGIHSPADGANDLQIAPPLPASWTTRMQLTLRGPLGRGFHLPPMARNVALACLDGTPFRLLPLVGQALNQQAAVAVYSSVTPAGLPEEVEVLPPDLLPEAIAWADFLALDARSTGLPELRSRLGLDPFQKPVCQVQILVVSPMPCGGLGACGICAVATRERKSNFGSAFACTDGPVFDYLQLDG